MHLQVQKRKPIEHNMYSTRAATQGGIHEAKELATGHSMLHSHVSTLPNQYYADRVSTTPHEHVSDPDLPPQG